MSLYRRLTAFVILAGTIGTSGTVQASVVSSATRVALQKSDVPAGYAFQLHTYSNAGMVGLTGIPKAQFDQHGRITGVTTDFAHSSSAIHSFVSQYRTAAGAAWEYTKSVASDLHNGHKSAAAKIGDRSTGFTATGKSATGVAVTEYGIDFQNGVYDMTAAVIGPTGKVSMNNALHYARIMVSRAH